MAGTQEPIYGPSAIKSVAAEAGENTHTELTRDDIKWQEMDSTNVESQTFYLLSEDDTIGMAQIIYSNVAYDPTITYTLSPLLTLQRGIRVTATFNVKVFSKDVTKPHLWCSTSLNNINFSDDHTAFFADDCAVELSEDGTSYTIKSANDENGVVNLKVTRTAPGFQAGKTGKTLFGTDLENPWGSMRHAFWPRCVSEGTITTKEGPINFKGRALYSYALQGMKPHHAACRWNFVDFQGPNYSAIMMEFTTPPSYGSTTVNVGGIVKDGAVVIAGSAGKATHTAIKKDAENDWPAPSAVQFLWNGTDKDGTTVEGIIEGELGDRADKVDVMAEVPVFVKKIVAGAVGTKPYIYQVNYPHQPPLNLYSNPLQFVPKVTLKLKIGDEVIEEEGQLFSEATFISE